MKADLEEVKKGATWQNIYDTLWHIGTVRYVTREQLKGAFSDRVWCKKCVTPKKIQILADRNFINQSDNGALTITAKTTQLLKNYSNYNTDIIKLPQGKGERDTLYNAETLLQAIKLPNFYALFYPEFYEKPTDRQPFLIPDGALVLRKEDKAKLIFLEIEKKKPDWENHMKGKKWKYETIAEREETWLEWWKGWCLLLKLNHCSINKFGFNVYCVGEFKDKENWKGWFFTKSFNGVLA